MIRCLIVDDEIPARELIEHHLSALADFEVVASFANGLDAFSYLQKHPVGLAFIDINMPRLSGLELIRSLQTNPKIILTTAYREYAAEAFELDVVDYLVKPITQERFMKAIAKFLQGQETLKNDGEAFLFFKVGREQVKVFLKDIIYIEGFADYIKVHTTSKYYIASEKLGYMEAELPPDSFTRIHKSFIVALDKVSSYTAEQVLLKGTALPLGRLFKAGFLKAVQLK
jgi:DNA-binding LytR/AlgR family response regulator